MLFVGGNSDWLVAVIDECTLGGVSLDLLGIDHRISHDDHLVSKVYPVSGCAIRADYSAAALFCDDVCLEPVSVVDVYN